MKEEQTVCKSCTACHKLQSYFWISVIESPLIEPQPESALLSSLPACAALLPQAVDLYAFCRQSPRARKSAAVGEYMFRIALETRSVHEVETSAPQCGR